MANPVPVGAGSGYLLDLIRSSLAQPTPAFWISAGRIRHNYDCFRRGLPAAQVFYPVKVNPDAQVIAILRDAGASFDAASIGEIRRLRELGVDPERIAFTTPVKPLAEIHAANRLGVRYFVADNDDEIAKLAETAPGSQVLVRFSTPSIGSQWPLSHRFGADLPRVGKLLRQAAAGGLRPVGLAFHVGSQCTRVEQWLDAIEQAAMIIAEYERGSDGPLRVLDLGGGFPVSYLTPVPPLAQVLAAIRGCLDAHFGSRRIDVWVEPGRALVGDAAVGVTTVTGRAQHRGRHWLFCDLGAFNGLLELIEPSSDGFAYEVVTMPQPAPGGTLRSYDLAGPSCDGDDVLAQSVLLPDVHAGDRLYFLKTGAYSLSYASRFCDSAEPAVYVV